MSTSAPSPVTSNFDYTSLDLDTASFVRQQTGELKALMQRAAQDIFEIGQRLIEVKEKLGHGNYLNWLEAEFGWTDRTARNYTTVAKQFKSETISNLPIAPSALYILAAPSTPVEIREEAIARAQSGEPITKKKATAMTRSHSIGQKKKASDLEEKILESSEGKTSPIADQNATFYREPEIIDAELESPPPQLPLPTPKSEAIPDKQVLEPDEVKALPPSPKAAWWRLSGKEQKHLLFCGHPEDTEFLAQLPLQIGLWMGFPPTPDNWQSPPKDKKIKTALSYSTSYQGINLKAIRELMERLIPEISSEDDETAAIAYLPDAPLLFLFDDFGLDCYIAEPSESQCQTIVKAWKDLDGKVEKLETLEEGVNT
jgi:Protein of unknown function (DUF3102)